MVQKKTEIEQLEEPVLVKKAVGKSKGKNKQHTDKSSTVENIYEEKHPVSKEAKQKTQDKTPAWTIKGSDAARERMQKLRELKKHKREQALQATPKTTTVV